MDRRSRQRVALGVGVALATAVVVSACGGGPDILAEGEREVDPLVRPAEIATRTPVVPPAAAATQGTASTPTPLATPTPTATAPPAAEPTRSPSPALATPSPTAEPSGQVPTSAVAPVPSASAEPTARATVRPTPKAQPTSTATPAPTPRPTATPTPTPRPTATATPQPAPIRLSAPAVIRAELGQRVDTRIDVAAPTGTAVVSVTVENAPPGLQGTTSFRPSQPGTWRSTVVVADSFGRVSRSSITFEARHRPRPDAVVAMGDSIASGHGLQLRDYLGGDSCYRSGDGYPSRVVDALVDGGDLPQSARLALVACSGADAGDLSIQLVTGGLPETQPEGSSRRTQLDWAIAANPGLVLLSVGINDLGFVNPERLIVDGMLDDALVQPRLDRLTADLSTVLDTLIQTTDATIVVTGYYNPTATRPQGIPGCETDCFVGVTTDAVERLNGAIQDALPGGDRVVYVDLAPTFVGHGAPNGLGPDGARAGLGFLGGFLGDYTQGVQPYCARGDTRDDSWLNAVDCVHPTVDGARAIAREIVNALEA